MSNDSWQILLRMPPKRRRRRRIGEDCSPRSVRPTVEDAGRVLLETHCLEWPASMGIDDGYGQCVRVELLHSRRSDTQYEAREVPMGFGGQESLSLEELVKLVLLSLVVVIVVVVVLNRIRIGLW